VKRKKLIWTIVLVPILISTLMATAATSSMSMVSVDPAVIWNSAMVPGTQFPFDIVVDYVENLWGYQFWLSFDPTVLQGVSVENGPFLGSAEGDVLVTPGPGFWYYNETDDSPDWWPGATYAELKLFGASIFFMGPPPDDAILPDGGGVLATVTFEVVGTGCSPIELGPETGLANKYGEWIFYGGDPPEWDDIGKPGFFSNTEEAPELYIRTRGAHGLSGIWPEWQVGLPDSTQTLYCEVFNYGFMGAYVAVEFVVIDPLGGIEKYMSNQAWVDPAVDIGVPSSVTVSVSFCPGIPGKYQNNAILYFEAGCMTEKAPYYLVEDTLDGEGLSRVANVGFKVQEHL
jgi:hypothetical protein